MRGIARHLAGFLVFIALAFAPASASEPVTSVTGSEDGYHTTTRTRTQGSLDDEDFRQVSLLTSRVLGHVNAASQHLMDEDREAARPELEKARRLVGVIREILPVTEVETVVRDPDGREVYRHRERVQDDLIPVYEKMIALEVIRPIVDAKKDQAAVAGIELSDAEFYHTSVLVDLDYVERKLARAERLLDRPDEAASQLLLAQLQGVQLDMQQKDDPLAKAQAALRLAERNLEQGKLEGARANLRLAQTHLDTYRTLVGEQRTDAVAELQERIGELSVRLEEPGALASLRGFWSRVTGWMTDRPGQVGPVGAGPGPDGGTTGS